MHRPAFLVAFIAITVATGWLATPAAASSVVLHDQFDHQGNETIPSSELPGYPDYGSELADDFVVPGGVRWSIDEIDVGGSWSSQVEFAARVYRDAGSLPGSLVAERVHQSPIDQQHPGLVPIDPPIALGPGHYWLSMQGDGFQPGQEWRWLDRTVGDGAHAAWRNPGGGYQIGCETFTPRTACWGGSTEPDQFFRLLGTAAVPALKTSGLRIKP